MNRKGEAKIVHAFDIYEENDEDISPDEILYEEMPKAIREFGSKFFALVMPATHQDSEGQESDVLILMTSHVGEMNCMQTTLDREDEYIEIEGWEQKDPEVFENIAVPFRHAITLQG